jgi:multiple sugar transport system substrate-binding protein
VKAALYIQAATVKAVRCIKAVTVKTAGNIKNTAVRAASRIKAVAANAVFHVKTWPEQTRRASRAWRRRGWKNFRDRLAQHKTGPRAERFRWYGGLSLLALSFIIGIGMKGGVNFPIINSIPVPEDRTLIFSQWWEDALGEDFLQTVIREFEEKNPDIKIRLDRRSWTEIRDYLALEEDSEMFHPDILALDPRWNPGDSKKLEALGRTAEGKTIQAQPLVSFMIPLFYNIKLLEQAGFDRPPKTRSEFTAFARAVTKPEAGRYGLALGLSEKDPQGVYRDILPWIWASGTPLEKEGKLDFNSDAVVAALQFLSNLNGEGLIAPGSFSKTGKDRIEDFKAGRAAMLLADTGAVINAVSRNGTSDTAPSAEGSPEDSEDVSFGLTTAPPPASYPGKPVFGVSSWYAGIFRSSRYRAEGRAFIRYLAEQSPLIAARAGGIPWNSDTAGGLAGSFTAGLSNDAANLQSGENTLVSKMYTIYHAGEAAALPAALPETSPEGESAGVGSIAFFERIVTEELRKMFEGGQSPEDTAGNVQRRWESRWGSVKEEE